MALNLPDYVPNQWEPGMPITQGRMETVETGIYENREALKTLDNSVTTISNDLSTKASTEQLEEMNLSLQEIVAVNSGKGQAAWDQILKVITFDNATQTVVQDLGQVKGAIDAAITRIDATIGTKVINGQEVSAYNNSSTIYNAIEGLKDIIGRSSITGEPMYSYNATDPVANNTIYKNIHEIQQQITAAKGNYDTIAERFTYVTTKAQTAQDTADLSWNQIKPVIGITGEQIPTTIDSNLLLQRFVDDENAISSKVSSDNIVNDLNTQDTTQGHVLDARQGRAIKDLLYKSTDTAFTTSDTVASRIKGVNDRINTLNTQLGTNNYGENNTITDDINSRIKKSDIENSLTYEPAQDTTDDKVLDARQGKVLNDRLVAIENEVNAAHRDLGLDENEEVIVDSLNKRFVDAELIIEALRTEITNAHASATMSDTTYSTLDDRLEAIENYAAAIRTDVTSIADELAMVDEETDAIKNTNTKIDDLERDIRAFAAELAMGRDENGALVDANTRIDTIQNELIAAHRDSNDTLDTRFDNIENAISHTKDESDENDLGGLTERVTAVETLASNAATQTALSDLTGRVSTLEREPKSATVVIANNAITYNDDGVPTNIGQTPVDNKDYLLQGAAPDTKYYYWKYINNSWNLISGGGGSGNSSGFVYNATDYAALENKTENTDYYVLEADGYHHYRWVGENEIEIGVPESKKYNIDIESIENEGTTINYLNLYEFNYDEDNTIDDNTNLNDIVSKRIRRILLPATGGGGGVTNALKVIQVPSRNVYKAANSNTATYLRFFFTSGEANEPASYTLTIDGVSIFDAPINITSGDPVNKAYTWPVDENNEELSTEAAAALGFYSIDITKYCTTIGTHTATVTVALDSNAAITAPATWNINTFNLSLTSNFTNNAIVNTGSTVSFSYIPSGNIEKTVHFKLDGTEIDTVVLAARVSTTQTYTIPAQSEPGAHKLEVYLTANSGMVKSASVFRDIIWQAAGDSTIILASPYRNNQETLTQYSTIDIPYTIAGGNGNYNVSYYVDDFENSVNEITLTNNNTGTWSYRADTVGNHTLRIKCEESYIDVRLVVTELQNVDIAPVTANLVLDFNPTGITNTSAKRLWSNDNYNLTVSDNFDWYNGGYGSDINGDYFLVKAGTRAMFNYYMFNKYTKSSDGGTTTTDASVVYRDGTEFKIIFKTDAVRKADAVWFTNMGKTSDSTSAKEVGIQLNVHNGWLKTDAAGDSTKSYLYFPYSEEDKIELDININKETEPNGVYCMSYEDGCPSRAYPYSNIEALYQTDAKPIVIGSDDCDVYIYRIRIYNSSLTTEEVLRNFIADGKDVNESIDRYNRNCIYYDTQAEVYTPYEGPDTILDPVRLAQKLPDVKILMLDTPHFTTSKKDFIPYSTLRCIHAEGGTIYPSRGKEDNWFFGNGYHAGQGTTSDKYGNAGRNVDFLFNCDGEHNPSDKIKPGKGFIEGYQSYVIKGYGTEEQEEPEYCTNWKGDSGKISLTSTSIPNNFFNLKVNIASSENVNNALFQKRYNDYLPYLSPAYLRDNRIKNDMEFVPAILFVRENDDEHTTTTMGDYEVVNYTNHTEFNDKEWHFYALGNIGDSKKSDYTRAYNPDDMNEFTLEISDNNTNNSQFQSGVYMKNGERTIEAYTLEQDMDDGKIVEGSFTANSSESDITVETTDYLYPIDKETEWEALDENGNPKNMRYWSLMNEGFDGNHSFEMRYACKGDYRDGKVVNDTTGKAKAQLALNTKVWQEFYTWLVTSSNPQFVNELDQWVVRSSAAYFYAFTHYYTMIDNRAKNTFWHFAQTGKHRIVSRPSANLLHIYEEADGEVIEKATEPGVWEGQFKPTEDTVIDSNKTYYTQYAFDMWAYDMDTAAGIDNNGELIFPYGKEDTDYRVDGDPTSGPVFNGAGSIFWSRLRENCNSDITAAFTGVSTECFNPNNLIVQFDRFQSCYPEAIWRLDVERKYIRPFTGDKGIKDSNPYQEIDLTRKETRFLGDMMQGRKKYQRRQWIKNQAAYFGSKYFLPIISDNNQFDMVCYTIGNQEVMPNWDLTITPYQDMYIRVDYAETPRGPYRAKAGKPIEVKCPFSSMNESRIRVYGADYIQELAGKPIKDDDGNIIDANSLASLYFRGNSFSNTHKLRKLIIGSSNATYDNNQFTTLNLASDSPILEVLDIQNCNGLTGSLNLSGATALKTIKAQGTALTSISLPSSTNIENLYLPTTITNLVLVAAKRLKQISFTDKNGQSSMANLNSIILNDSDYSDTINWMNIAATALPHLINLQLINLNHASIVDIDDLTPFAERKEELGTMQNEAGETISRINLTGLIHITGAWSEVERDSYIAIWPNLRFDVNEESKIQKHQVTFKYDDYKDEDGNIIKGEIIKTMFIDHGDSIVDIWQYTDPETQSIVHILDEMPSRQHTVRYNYQFGERIYNNYLEFSGWKLENATRPISDTGATVADGGAPVVTSDMVIETYFKPSYRTYPIKWYLEKNNDGKPKEDTLVKTTSNPVNYGDGYDEEAPTVTYIHDKGFRTATAAINNGQVTYSIFSGWEKLPTNINPTINDDSYNIFATWDTQTVALVDLFADVSTLTPAQLLTLSVMSGSQKTTYIGDRLDTSSQFTYSLGHDSIKSGVEIIGPNSNIKTLRLDIQTTSPLVTSIQPMHEDNDAFTIAIDYCFNENATYNSRYSAAMLMSCYSVDSTANTKSGFALYNSLSQGASQGIKVGFGDMLGSSAQSRFISSAATMGQRNIVVLRHPAGSSVLYIYSGMNTDISLSSTVTAQQIPWSALTSNAQLNFGQLTNSTGTEYATDKNSTTRAAGTVYWAKYWPEDLGVGECKSIASWPHENMTYAFAALRDTATVGDRAGSSLPSPSLVIAAVTTSAHGKVVQPIASTNVGDVTGWNTSIARTICNDRVFNGLPIELQSILCKSAIYTSNMVVQRNGYDNTYQLSAAELDRSYIYLSSAVNLGVATAYAGEENYDDLVPYDWFEDSGSVQVYNYNPNASGHWDVASDSNKTHYYNLRFPGYPIIWSEDQPLRIFRINGTEISSSTIYTEINNISGGIRKGDVYISSTGNAYMYITDSDIMSKGAQNEPNTGIFATEQGGWLASQDYWTRSIGFTNASRNNYVYVDTNGTLILNETRTASSNGLSLSYVFGI